MAETVLERMEGRVSYHDSVEEMLKRIKEDGLSSVFSRWPDQEKIRCKFCLQGLSCQLCSQGPCRISEKSGATRGVCGIGPDAMAMRNLLMQNIMGAATYGHHAYEAFRTLKATGQGKTPFKITDVDKLKWMCEKTGINTNQDLNQMAIQLADLFDKEMKVTPDEESIMVEAFAPKKRKKVWRDMHIYPCGVQHDVENSIASCLTNVDGDYLSLATKALRLGLSTIYTAQIGLEMKQDILFGTPMPHEVEVDLGIMDPDYVNIAFNGHQPWIGVATLQKAKKEEYQERARQAGAKGIHIVGSIETGQEMLQRFETDDVFVGLMGNWLAIEPFLATGTVDALVMEENCSPPAIDQYAEKYQVALVSVSTIIGVPGTEHKMPYYPGQADDMAENCINIAIENFKKRHGKVKAMVPKHKMKAIAGFSTEAVLKAINNDLNALVDVIVKGQIKGIVALANCATLRNGPHDWNTVNITKQLIKDNILVVAGGCGNHGLEVAGLCNMDADVPDLPIAITAPEWMEQKATIDGLFAVAYGAYTHLSPIPFVTGPPNLVKLLTEDVETLTGGKVALGDDPIAAAKGIEAHIMKKRKAMAI